MVDRGGVGSAETRGGGDRGAEGLNTAKLDGKTGRTMNHRDTAGAGRDPDTQNAEKICGAGLDPTSRMSGHLGM